jgi:hypothetical protein
MVPTPRIMMTECWWGIDKRKKRDQILAVDKKTEISMPNNSKK